MFKKFMLVLGLIFLIPCSVQATTVVSYMNTGVPAYVTHGSGPRQSINNFGRNATFSPAYQQRMRHRKMAAGHYARPARPRNARCRGCGSSRYYNNDYGYVGSGYNYAREYKPINSPKSSNVISSLDKNYKITPPKTYTINGITYYD